MASARSLLALTYFAKQRCREHFHRFALFRCNVFSKELEFSSLDFQSAASDEPTRKDSFTTARSWSELTKLLGKNCFAKPREIRFNVAQKLFSMLFLVMFVQSRACTLFPQSHFSTLMSRTCIACLCQ